MSAFRTILPAFDSTVKISHYNRILSLGSCFAEHIGGRLESLKFPICLNPFGILYNPISIQQSLEKLVDGYLFQEADLFHHRGLWNSFAHHGSFSREEKHLALEAINTQLVKAQQSLPKTDRLILTFGTAYVFILKETGNVVANCHKLPGQDFERRRLSIDEIVNSLKSTFNKLKETAPSLEIILTVSPVRHIRDGLEENQKSKATLLLALEQLVEHFNFVQYFPAYEIVLDDLRDYRFYKDDMIHPSAQAVDYIWEYFEKAYFKDATLNLNRRIEKIVAASRHRPLYPNSDNHQTFIKTQLEKIRALEQDFPFLNFDKERKEFQSF